MSKLIKKTGSAILGTSKRAKLEADYIAKALVLQSEIDKKKAEIKKIQSELSPIEDYFMEVLAKNEVAISPNGNAVKNVTNSYAFKPEYLKNFKDIFKKKVSDFVIEKISYGITPHLRKLLTDESYEHGELVRDAVLIESRESIQFKSV